MSDTKNCEYCGATFSRKPGMRLSKWLPRRFCSVACGAHCGGNATGSRVKKERASGPANIDPKYDDYSLEDVVRDCGGIDALAAHFAISKHAIRYWNRVPTRRQYEIRDLSGIPLAVIERVKKSEVVAEHPQSKPKITRIDPLPAGSAETWGAMMPGVSWADAQRDIAQMGAR
ncbi:hypothetical protein [Asaia bogorensis]|uniref:Uncharacterized protein n=1 Tax=Asaia bogorensis NBRC 16594 TaxID=1231624 RepID=A0AAN4R4S3_9PROT|nr:hypothetical protein [Asaia bogorensis]BAT19798.1 DNA-binding transcriptional regulator Cro domain protein [Asaia bogorensis NBRC 16594]GBQ77667.1 hypothetical protein AA0311_1511 [Asaia bogorensis NBRC 16594]GEL54362.1 hypothetical protein ABO01nite_23690 [Asaia bogorensis NBRC 16594]